MTEEALLWYCGTCGHQTGGPLPLPARCVQPSCPDYRQYAGGKFGGVLLALPLATDSALMAELRKRAPDHRYTSDREIIDDWLNTAKLGMQLPRWDLVFFAHLFETTRAELERLHASRAQPNTLQVGATKDGREVAINLPFTPDNSSGWVHYAFTPDQARDLGRLLLKKADEADTIRNGG